MKRKLLSTAIAALAASSAVHAFDPISTAPDYTLVISGATATTGTLEDEISFRLCDSASGQIDRFEVGAHWAVACTVKNGVNGVSGLAGGAGAIRKVLFLKNNGGSGTGAGALQQNNLVEVAVPVSRTNCTSVSKVATATAPAHFTNTACTLGANPITQLKKPDWGISDVEPAIFVNDLAPPPAEGGPFVPGGPALEVRQVAGLGFGVVTSLGFYRALQNEQFDTSNRCNPTPNNAKDPDGNDNDGKFNSVPISPAKTAGVSDTYSVVASDTLTPPAPKAGGPHRRGDTSECMPSLSRFEVNQVLSGKVPTLTELVNNAGVDIQTHNVASAWGTADTALYVCRRTNGSGTHAQTSIYFLGSQCRPGNDGLVATSTELPDQIFQNIGSGDMDRCLNALDQGVAYNSANITPVITIATATPSGGNLADGTRRYALGYQSVEKNSDFSGSYRFIKLDGRAPTLAEMHAGNYLNFGESTIQVRAAHNYNDTKIATFGDVAGVTNMFNQVANLLTVESKIKLANDNAKFQQPYGQAGFLIGPDPFGVPAHTPDPVLALTNPVGTFLHKLSGGEQNSCLEPQKGAAGVTPIPIGK